MQKVPPEGESYIPNYKVDPEFQEYKREFYQLRYEFFKRAPEPDGDCLDPATCFRPLGQYTDSDGIVHYFGVGQSCENCRAWSRWDNNGTIYKHQSENPDDDTNVRPDDKGNIRDFSIKANVELTMEQIGEEINRQVEAIKREVQKEKAGRVMLRDWLRGKGGKRLPTGKKDTFIYWRRCLEVYDRRADGDSWESIGIVVVKVDSSRPKGTITREARDHYNEAVRLIESAARGTFPD